MRVVSNSSSLIGLERIGQIELLRSLFGEVTIPSAVAAEISNSAIQHPWLKVEPLTRPAPQETERGSLGAGEREAIALAVELQASLVILDDEPARRIAGKLGIRIMGTVGVLLRAKEQGLIPAVRPHLDALLANRFFLTAELYDSCLVKSRRALSLTR